MKFLKLDLRTMNYEVDRSIVFIELRIENGMC